MPRSPSSKLPPPFQSPTAQPSSLLCSTSFFDTVSLIALSVSFHLLSICFPSNGSSFLPRNYRSSSMAGMLPGVESARRRRFHPSDSSSSCPYFTRRSSLCLYSSNHESLLSASSLQGRSDEKLAGAAGEAKERLGERLRSAQMRSSNKRQNIKEEKKSREGRQELHIEVYGSKKSGGSRMIFNLRKLI